MIRSCPDRFGRALTIVVLWFMAAPALVLGSSSLDRAIAEYLTYYVVQKTATAKAKAYDLDHLRDFLASKRCNQIERVTHAHIKEFLSERLSVEAPSTVNRRLDTIHHFFRHFSERDRGLYNPAQGIRRVTVVKPPPKDLDRDELKSLRDSVDRIQSRHQRLRTNAIIELMLTTGLRSFEVRGLTLGQLDLKKAQLFRVRRKGNRFENRSLPRSAVDALRAYIRERETQLSQWDNRYPWLSAERRSALPLFVSPYRAELERPETLFMSEKTLYREIRRRGMDADLKAHPHLLRHVAGHQFYRRSKDIRLTAAFMGHTSIQTTMRYTDPDESDIKAIQERMYEA